MRMLSILSNWKTTALGLGAALSATGTILTHLATGDTGVLATALPGLLAGLGLIFGKDFDTK